MLKRFLLLVFWPIFTFVAAAQADSARVYTSLEEALKEPGKVQKLDLTKNKLNVFPKEIFAFTNLRELYLGKNKIDSIPARIDQLTRLEVLDVSRNKLKEIPVEVFACAHLKKLILNQNLIQAIPEEIGRLQELEYLDMWSNELETIPRAITKCKKLKEVDLRVINFSNAEYLRIQQFFLDMKVKVYISPGCNCAH